MGRCPPDGGMAGGCKAAHLGETVECDVGEEKVRRRRANVDAPVKPCDVGARRVQIREDKTEKVGRARVWQCARACPLENVLLLSRGHRCARGAQLKNAAWSAACCGSTNWSAPRTTTFDLMPPAPSETHRKSPVIDSAVESPWSM
eukprot:4915633-Prymnesium_polylepis.1